MRSWLGGEGCEPTRQAQAPAKGTWTGVIGRSAAVMVAWAIGKGNYFASTSADCQSPQPGYGSPLVGVTTSSNLHVQVCALSIGSD